jgi:hypothetical protein
MGKADATRMICVSAVVDGRPCSSRQHIVTVWSANRHLSVKVLLAQGITLWLKLSQRFCQEGTDVARLVAGITRLRASSR